MQYSLKETLPGQWDEPEYQPLPDIPPSQFFNKEFVIALILFFTSATLLSVVVANTEL